MLDPREAYRPSSPYWGWHVSPVAYVKGPPMQTPGQFAEGPGDYATADYVARRRAIEAGRDDGTETHYRREKGPRDVYADDLPDPISDASPTHVLAYYGLGTREIELLERHLCLTIADVKVAIRDCEIIRWSGGGEAKATEQVIREAVEGIPG